MTSRQKYPLTPIDDKFDKEPRFTHPAMGNVMVTKRSGTRRMFGSEIEHHSTICMTFRGAAYHRQLSGDRYYGHGPTHLEVQFTPLQWAEMLSSMGDGGGTPVTYSFTTRDGTCGDLPEYKESHVKTFENEVKATAQKATERVREAHAALLALKKQSSVRKADLDAIINMLYHADMDMTSNVPFVMDQFQEATEKVVNDAKQQITGHIQGYVEQLGRQALMDRLGTDQPSVPTLDALVGVREG